MLRDTCLRTTIDISPNTWMEIDLDALKNNVKVVRRIVGPNTKILAVVKADGYGMGALQISQVAIESGADYLGVAFLEEALELKRLGIKVPILILGPSSDESLPLVVEEGFIQSVYNFRMAELLSREGIRQGKQVTIHVKLDVGMSRLGFSLEEAPWALERILQMPNLNIEGVFALFPSADKDKQLTLAQFSRFVNLLDCLHHEKGITFNLRHIANSAVILDLPQLKLDMVRPGIILHGLYPGKNIKKLAELRPILQLKTVISEVRWITKGTPVSYGGTYIAPEDGYIAVLPIGYAYGYSRALSNKGEVLISGKRRPIVGQICMDQTMVFLGKDTVKLGEEVVLIGSQENEEIRVEEIAEKYNTISYEVICQLSKRIPRFYIHNGKVIEAIAYNY